MQKEIIVRNAPKEGNFLIGYADGMGFVDGFIHEAYRLPDGSYAVICGDRAGTKKRHYKVTVDKQILFAQQ